MKMPLALKRMDHVGVSVGNYSEARGLIEKAFGLVSERETQQPTLAGAFFNCGDVHLEIFELRDSKQRSDRLGIDQIARIDHIAFEVEDVDDTLAALRALGLRQRGAQAIRKLSECMDPYLRC